MAAVYKTKGGDAWDLIAYLLYGNERYMKNLIEANPGYSDVLRFDAGIELKVPDLPAEDEEDEDLPFWHSGDDNSFWAEEAE